MASNLIFKWFFGPFVFFFKLGLWLTGIAFIALVVFLTFFDLNTFKEEIERAGTSFLQQEMKINGDVRLGMQGFSPSIVLHNVKIGEDGRTTVTLTDRLEITLPFSKPDPQNPFSVFANMDNIRIDGRAWGDYDFPVKVVPQGISIPDIKGNLAGGKVSGHASLLSGVMDVDIQLRDAGYDAVLPAAKEGDVKVDIVLKGVYPRLSGHARLDGGKGYMAGNIVQLFAGDLFSAVLHGARHETDINCTMIEFDVVNGVAHAKKFVFDTTDATVYGAGYIDLRTSMVDMRFAPKPKNKTLLTLATPVRVQGLLGNVQVMPDTASLAAKLGGMALGAVNPAMALIPFMSAGSGNPCAAVVKK